MNDEEKAKKFDELVKKLLNWKDFEIRNLTLWRIVDMGMDGKVAHPMIKVED